MRFFEIFHHNFGLSLIIILLALGILSLCCFGLPHLRGLIIKPTHRLYTKDFSLRLMAIAMGIVLLCGTILYIYVFYTIHNDSLHNTSISGEKNEPHHFSYSEYLLRSLICSLDLFMLDMDSNIMDKLGRHPIVKAAISIQAAISFSCTIIMLIGLVYSRIIAFIKLKYITKINDTQNHLYLFFGYNEPTLHMIKDIIDKDPKAIAVLIDEANVKDDDNDEWSGIVSLFVHKPKVFKVAKKIKARVAIASRQLADIDEDMVARKEFDALGYLGLSKIKRMIKRLYKTESPQLHIFFMSEDEELNFRNINVLSKDKTIMSIAADHNWHRIYCHARYNGLNRVLQDVALEKHLNIEIIDTSHLAVELLKSDTNYHPVNVVKTDERDLTTVSVPLKTLIVGFGEVGRDTFRFLYEFGAFVDTNNANNRSRFECTIVDRNLDDIKGSFIASMPGVFDPKYKDANTQINFLTADCNSHSFNTELLTGKFLTELNYVVISIDDIDEAIALAIRIFDSVRKFRSDLSNLRILVRCTRTDKYEAIQKIADHYNHGYNQSNNNPSVIQIFGLPNQIYTYDIIVSSRFTEEGKSFHKEYCKHSGEKESWDQRHKRLTSPRPSELDKLRQLHRKESQDKANSLHAYTKINLLSRALEHIASANGSKLDWSSFYQRYFTSDDNANVQGSKVGISYPGLSAEENKIILRLAQLEHLRWNAAHQLMGYLFNESGTSCDERTMTHNCLCEWDKLDAQSDKITRRPCDYKKYDYCVVDTTIAINKEK